MLHQIFIYSDKRHPICLFYLVSFPPAGWMNWPHLYLGPAEITGGQHNVEEVSGEVECDFFIPQQQQPSYMWQRYGNGYIIIWILHQIIMYSNKVKRIAE